MTEPDVTYQESAMVAMRHMDTEVRTLVNYSIRLEKFNDELYDALQACKAKNAKLRELLQEVYEDQCDDDDRWKYTDRMRELGVEL